MVDDISHDINIQPKARTPKNQCRSARKPENQKQPTGGLTGKLGAVTSVGQSRKADSEHGEYCHRYYDAGCNVPDQGCPA